MIHFDLIDLPGVQNGRPVAKKLVQKYFQKDRLNHTFMLLFQDSKGNTSLEISMVLSAVEELLESKFGTTQQNKNEWMQSNCLGVLTKVDKLWRLIQTTTPSDTTTSSERSCRRTSKQGTRKNTC